MIYIIELNIEFALKLKEKIRTTLDGMRKELESFARQIASGMVNFLHNTLFLELLVERLQIFSYMHATSNCCGKVLAYCQNDIANAVKFLKSATCFAKFQSSKVRRLLK